MAIPSDRSVPAAPAIRADAADTLPLAVITGASRGIGYEMARELGERGYRVCIVAEDDAVYEAASRLRAVGVTVEPLRADLRIPEDVESLSRLLTARTPLPEIVAFNAGVGVGGAFLETSLERELDMLRLNVVSVVHLAKRVVGPMAKRGRGHLLFTASLASEVPAPFMAVYGASKAFVLSFAEALRNELRDTGVSVTAVLPGPTDTDFFRRAGMNETRVARGALDDAADVAEDAVDAVLAGDDKRVAGSFRNRLMAALSHVTPDVVNADLHRRLAEPLSRGDDAPAPSPRPMP
jgi:short-subunit dehydrogenase